MKTISVDPKELTAFLAGWDAAEAFRRHEWGPQPPTGRPAFLQWKNTCEFGHPTFEIFRTHHHTLGCGGCDKVFQRGEVR